MAQGVGLEATISQETFDSRYVLKLLMTHVSCLITSRSADKPIPQSAQDGDDDSSLSSLSSLSEVAHAQFKLRVKARYRPSIARKSTNRRNRNASIAAGNTSIRKRKQVASTSGSNSPPVSPTRRYKERSYFGKIIMNSPVLKEGHGGPVDQARWPKKGRNSLRGRMVRGDED
jgi:hypothetical protein